MVAIFHVSEIGRNGRADRQPFLGLLKLDLLFLDIGIRYQYGHRSRLQSRSDRGAATPTSKVQGS